MVTKEEILNIAKLSKLFIDENELDDLADSMSNIINFANQINKAEGSKEEFDNINNLSNVLRTDVVQNSFDRELILKNADGGKNGFFYVKSYK